MSWNADWSGRQNSKANTAIKKWFFCHQTVLFILWSDIYDYDNPQLLLEVSLELRTVSRNTVDNLLFIINSIAGNLPTTEDWALVSHSDFTLIHIYLIKYGHIHHSDQAIWLDESMTALHFVQLTKTLIVIIYCRLWIETETTFTEITWCLVRMR